MFCLESEDLTGLGGPMGTEQTSTNFRLYFKTLEDAKAHAEKNYKATIKWNKKDGEWSSGDLSYVMYHITKIKLQSKGVNNMETKIKQSRNKFTELDKWVDFEINNSRSSYNQKITKKEEKWADKVLKEFVAKVKRGKI